MTAQRQRRDPLDPDLTTTSISSSKSGAMLFYSDISARDELLPTRHVGFDQLRDSFGRAALRNQPEAEKLVTSVVDRGADLCIEPRSNIRREICRPRDQVIDVQIEVL